MDGPRLARSKSKFGVLVWSDHVSGLYVRSVRPLTPMGNASLVPSIAAC
jgi:hypothetical protein